VVASMRGRDAAAPAAVVYQNGQQMLQGMHLHVGVVIWSIRVAIAQSSRVDVRLQAVPRSAEGAKGKGEAQKAITGGSRKIFALGKQTRR